MELNLTFLRDILEKRELYIRLLLQGPLNEIDE